MISTAHSAPPSQAASLLIAALVMLRHPCARNKAAAKLLLGRAAEAAELAPAEREACLIVADDLDIGYAESPKPQSRRTSTCGIRNDGKCKPGIPDAARCRIPAENPGAR